PLPISADDTAGSLHDKLAALGAEAIVALLPGLAATAVVPQDDAQACYAAKIGKDEARLDWTLPAAVLDRRIRAFNPFPGASALLDGEAVKIWQARPAEGNGRPGEILALTPQAVRVACGTGALDLLEVQKAGAKRLPVAAFLAGNPLAVGQRLN
ncbi:MAG: methionyl-tRNA formyltransferase, partial [Thiobacillus sp.]|nr:methionyl-tRNA formyltransferase [Thiobacillus sp.]